MRIKLRKIIIEIQPLVLGDILGGHSTGRGGVGGGNRGGLVSIQRPKKLLFFGLSLPNRHRWKQHRKNSKSNLL